MVKRMAPHIWPLVYLCCLEKFVLTFEANAVILWSPQQISQPNAHWSFLARIIWLPKRSPGLYPRWPLLTEEPISFPPSSVTLWVPCHCSGGSHPDPQEEMAGWGAGEEHGKLRWEREKGKLCGQSSSCANTSLSFTRIYKIPYPSCFLGQVTRIKILE